MMRLSLLSEGLLFVKENWKITGEGGVKTCKRPADLNIAPVKPQGRHVDLRQPAKTVIPS